jgi:hypothetical protein
MSDKHLLVVLALALSAQLPLTGQSSPWTHFTLAPTGPTLGAPPMVYDSASNTLIVFGGVIQTPCCTSLNDTWVLANANATGAPPSEWLQLSPTGPLPPARIADSAVYDQRHHRMIIFGGGQPGCGTFCTLFDDVWVLSNANGVGGTPTWTQLAPATPNGLPAPRAGQGAIYDPSSNRMTIFAGGNNGTGDMNDVWVLTNANGLAGQPKWIPLSPAGPLPAPREGAVTTYDSTSNVMTVFGGCCPFVGDLWVLSDANGLGSPAWKEVSPKGAAPGTVATYSYGYDQATDSLLLFGGQTSAGVFSDYVWELTDANDVKGTPTWVNTIANNSPGSPPSYSPPAVGTYDSVSKRFMVVPDPADLWVLTTRNGIDVSCSAGVPTATQLAQFRQSGIEYVVVEAPQMDVGLCTGQIETAQQQLDTFAGGGFKTAAYCFLYFSADSGTGTQQAQNCLDTIGSARMPSVNFVAIDVEETKAPPVPVAMRRTIISDALQAIADAGAQPVIYTTRQAWSTLAGSTAQFQSYPMWSGAAGTFRNSAGRAYCGDGVASLTPFTAFSGWTVRLGKQYDIGTEASCSGALLYGIKVDFDVFDPSLFP